MNQWTSAARLRQRLQKEWNKGRLLSAALKRESIYPLKITLKHPSAGELGQQFSQVKDWIDELARFSRPRQATGYNLEYQEVNHRQLGKNQLPITAVFENEADALSFIGKQKAAVAFHKLCNQALSLFPDLRTWLIKRPLTALELVDQWPKLLAVLKWFSRHPRPGIYLRQLEIPEVDSKFIEQHKKILSELLDIVLPERYIETSSRGITNFEKRYGFISKLPQIRFRLLDPGLALGGLTDLQISADDFSRLKLKVSGVFITENEINGLAFPGFAKAMVIFGLGYGLDSLAKVSWLKDKAIYYWGDIDTHGFAMLDQIRFAFPQTVSFLMDRKTLLEHKALWGQEPKSISRNLTRLTKEEAALYLELKNNSFAMNLRLEQERISYTRVKAALQQQGTWLTI